MSTPIAMSGDWRSIDVMTLQVLPSNPYELWLYPMLFTVSRTTRW